VWLAILMVRLETAMKPLLAYQGRQACICSLRSHAVPVCCSCAIASASTRSSGICFVALDASSTCQVLTDELLSARLLVTRCVCAGTFIAGMLARHHRKRVHTLCLIDPVCFGMFMPHLLHNFLYRVPTKRGHKLSE
jgi:hypothetical protein